MALQLGALRDALDAVGVDRDLARKAAEEVAAHDDKLQTVRLEMAEIKSDVRLLKSMVGACGAGIMSIILGVIVLLLRTRGLAVP